MADPVEIGSPWAGCREAIADAWCFHSVGRGVGGEMTEVVDVDKGDGNNGVIVLSLNSSAKSACGRWGRASSSPSLYAGEGNNNRPRSDDNVASTLNSYNAGKGHSDPPRTDDNVAYTFSGQEGGPNSTCGGWGRASLSLSLYAGKGNSNRPRRDEDVASTSNKLRRQQGQLQPPQDGQQRRVHHLRTRGRTPWGGSGG
jgi:hypothetical protein